MLCGRRLRDVCVRLGCCDGALKDSHACLLHVCVLQWPLLATRFPHCWHAEPCDTRALLTCSLAGMLAQHCSTRQTRCLQINDACCMGIPDAASTECQRVSFLGLPHAHCTGARRKCMHSAHKPWRRSCERWSSSASAAASCSSTDNGGAHRRGAIEPASPVRALARAPSCRRCAARAFSPGSRGPSNAPLESLPSSLAPGELAPPLPSLSLLLAHMPL